jgi:hypothetical protein
MVRVPIWWIIQMRGRRVTVAFVVRAGMIVEVPGRAVVVRRNGIRRGRRVLTVNIRLGARAPSRPFGCPDALIENAIQNSLNLFPNVVYPVGARPHIIFVDLPLVG